MQIKTVALIGAGAIGCYFISCLNEKMQGNFWVVAEGERKARLETQGVLINDKQYKLNVKTPAEAKGADVVIVGVKYNALPGVLSMLDIIVDEHTIVLSPMNGVDSEDIIGAEIGDAKVVRSFMYIASERIGNSIKFNPEKTKGLTFGELDGSRTERIEALDALFTSADLHHYVSKHIAKDIWSKYGLNIGRNLPQAILKCGQGAYNISEHLQFITGKLVEEVVAVAKAKGVDLGDDFGDDFVEKIKNHRSPFKARFSTLQDLDAKRKTEIDMFAGTLIRLAKEEGIAVPYNEFAYHAIKTLEEINEGVIE